RASARTRYPPRRSRWRATAPPCRPVVPVTRTTRSPLPVVAISSPPLDSRTPRASINAGREAGPEPAGYDTGKDQTLPGLEAPVSVLRLVSTAAVPGEDPAAPHTPSD